MTNLLGNATVKGELIAASPRESMAFTHAPANALAAGGILYESGVANAAQAWVVVAGIAEALVETTAAATAGKWVSASYTQVGRIEANTAGPPDATTPPLTAEHFHELGHCLSNADAGSLVNIFFHPL
jgi:hypothetical protein